jgi:hypothetical protein
MAGTPKWKGIAGLARTADASSTASPQVYPIADDVDTPGAPVTYERTTSQQADILHITRCGTDYNWVIDGMQGSAFDIGYLFYLLLGTDTWAAGPATHTLTPATNSQYANLKVDRDVQIGTGGTDHTQECVGCRVGSFTFDQPMRDYAKINAGGLFCNLATPSASLSSPSISVGDDDEPPGWAHLQDGSAFFKIEYDGGGLAQDDAVQSWKMEYSREQVYSGIDVGDSQPDGINEGGRELTFEITREFIDDSGSKDSYDAWENGKTVGIDIKYIMGANYVQITIPQAHVVGSFAQSVGTGAESIMATLMCKAFKGSNPLITVVVKDGSSAAYT